VRPYGETVSHEVSDDVAVHPRFDVTGMVVEFAVFEGTGHESDPTVKTGSVRSCRTGKFKVAAGSPDVTNVRYPRLPLAALRFAATDTVTMPFPDPDVGDTVNHDELDDTDQFAFEVTCNVMESAAAGASQPRWSSVSPLPACVTVIVRVSVGDPTIVETVMVPVRSSK